MCVFIGAQSMKNSANTKRRIRSFEAAEDVDSMLERARCEGMILTPLINSDLRHCLTIRNGFGMILA